MRPHDSPLSYDKLLRAFIEAINGALVGAAHARTSALFDVPVTLAILDIAHAAREERPTRYLVARACAAFATYAADHEAGKAPQEAKVHYREAGF